VSDEPTVTPDATTRDLAAARATLGLSVDQMASELGVTPHVVEAWESGRLAVPRKHAQHLAYRLAVAERERALAASGLAECAWLTAWEAAEVPHDRRLWEKHMLEGQKHLASCAVCNAREQYLRERFGPLPVPPMPAWVGVVQRVSAWLERRPVWARPAIVGATLVAAMTLVRVLLSLPLIIREPRNVVPALEALLFGAAIGGAVGAIVGVIRRRLRRG
jgi:DNA-binding XRE family transcriptional regulator